jgi:DNA-binding GntR family transcriptional regulator
VYHLLSLLEATPPAWWPDRQADELKELQGLHAELEAAAHDRDRFFAAQRALSHALLEIADNRWRARWWPTCAR